MMKHRLGLFLLAGTAAGAGLLVDGAQRLQLVVAQSVDEGCPETSGPDNQTGSTLEGFANDSGDGVIYDGTGSELILQKAGGNFSPAALALSDTFTIAASADFDEDGWTDFVAGSAGDFFLRFYKNETGDNPEPDWNDPSDIRTPKFTRTVDIRSSSSTGGGHAGMTSGDFNQDGHADFFAYYNNVGADNSNLDTQHIYLGNGNGTFQSAYNASTSAASFGYFTWMSGNSAVYDWNHDGWPDIIFGTKLGNPDNKGAVMAFLNNCPDVWTSPTTACSVNPQFVGTEIIKNLNYGNRGVDTVAVADFNQDGFADLITGSPSLCTPLRMYKGLATGGVDTSTYEIVDNGGFPDGAATTILVDDFSLDGYPDLVFGTDNFNCPSNLGGAAYYHKNEATSPSFSGGADTRLTRNGQVINGVTLKDYDLGVLIDYDNDPDGTKDFMIADGNHTSSFYVFANRVVSEFVECGEVESGILDLGPLVDAEMVVTGARISPDMDLPSGTSVTFYMSNEEPANWELASACPDDASDYCVSFPKATGRDVRWKAEMCSNAAKTSSPAIAGVEISFDYTEADEHYRAGVVVSDGVSYIGGFRQPGNSGHFYAINAGLDQTYWDFADVLNATSDSDRTMYSASTDGTTRLDFTDSTSDANNLVDTLGVASSTQAKTIVNWQRSARFGVAEDSRLGSVELSTPAVVTVPVLPFWYPDADEDSRDLIDQFISDQADRDQIVIFGSKDGAIHAVRTLPTDIGDSVNGVEAWAWIPASVASGFSSDMANGTTTSYPDGSPTVGDVILDDGEVHTVAIVSGGNGSRAVTAIDITDTLDPQPLWEVVPGGSSAGEAVSKPVIARVEIGGNTKFYAIMATGVASENPIKPFTKGREVVAVDMTTGATVWQFQSECAVTSDLVIFETDDELEPDSPAIDGYIDRAVWADACGNIYKVNPAQNVGSNYLEGYGSISTGHTDPDGQAVMAIFSTATSDCALGAERPIVGTIGARSDAADRVSLFFGTGGLESYDPSEANAFYAVYTDTGEIRGCAEGVPEKGVIEGECTAGVCEKFYGGVVVTTADVIVTRATDPPVGTGTCEFGTSEIAGFSISEFNEDFTVATSSATVSSLYGDGGALYFATLAGDIVRIGTPRAQNAGDDTASGDLGGQAGGADGNSSGEGLGILGWRVVD